MKKSLIFIFLVSFSLLFIACQPQAPVDENIKTLEKNIQPQEINVEVDEIQELETFNDLDDFNLSELDELDDLDKQLAELENLEI